ncbi:hypothetical protein [Pseudomonas sp. Irchel s3h17]|uniref:hypothetical protein n=1 Tax=Pseudomonas sp. Irchel s3h17 TaxID=2009182 RepID=UPI000BA4B5B3|nr:hypothetical protein [Pseudomonas sp. Irchel s3h17]
MKLSHKKCMKFALDELKKETIMLCGQQVEGGHLTALIDGVPFVAEDVRGFHSYGVRIIVGLIGDASCRRYITVAVDDDLGPGEYDVTLEGEVTIGYVIENSDGYKEYSAEQGNAGISCATDDEFSGVFCVTLGEDSPYHKITDASFAVRNTTD